MKKSKVKTDDCNQPKYCLVKVCHYECTGKPLKCKDCILKCKYKESIGGDNNDKPAN